MDFDCVFDFRSLYLAVVGFWKIALWHFMLEITNHSRKKSNNKKRKIENTECWLEKFNEKISRISICAVLTAVAATSIAVASECVLAMYLICGIVHYYSLFSCAWGAFNTVQIGFTKDISMWPKSKGKLHTFLATPSMKLWRWDLSRRREIHATQQIQQDIHVCWCCFLLLCFFCVFTLEYKSNAIQIHILSDEDKRSILHLRVGWKLAIKRRENEKQHDENINECATNEEKTYPHIQPSIYVYIICVDKCI